MVPGFDVPRSVADQLLDPSVPNAHLDEAARSVGFRGAIVPGVYLLAQAAGPAVDVWGQSWLAHGRMDMAHTAPLYDGDEVHLTYSPVVHSRTGHEFHCILQNREREICAIAHFGLPKEPPAPPSLAEFESGDRRTVDKVSVADERLRVGLPLPSSACFELTRPQVEAAWRNFGPTAASNEGTDLAPPTAVTAPSADLDLRRAGIDFSGMLIHYSMSQRMYAPIRIGDSIQSHGRVAGVWKTRRSKYLDLDILFVANGSTPVALRRVTTIYDFRGKVDGGRTETAAGTVRTAS